MTDRYSEYDVLDKFDTLSWNDKTRRVVSDRMSLDERRDALTGGQYETLRRVVERICPQPEKRAPANTLAVVLDRIERNAGDGFRPASLPALRECWRRGLDAIDAEARKRHDKPFADLDGAQADGILAAVENGKVEAADWESLPSKTFWEWRLIPDIVSAHWSHPSLWSQMGFGGPASPRGYVRLEANRRDPWEAQEKSGD